jgi:hypothetical protein
VARRAHAYLCFTFGSNEAEAWKAISETVDGNQTRQISRPGQPNGGNSLSLSKLGLRIDAGEGSAHAVSHCGVVGEQNRVGDGSLKEVPIQHSAEGGHVGSAGKRQVNLIRRWPRGILK